MKKKLLVVVLLIVMLAFVLNCFCSCRQSFNYDWSEIDKLMNESDFGSDLYNSQGNLVGKKLNILSDKTEDREMTVTLVRENKFKDSSKLEYILLFNIYYYNLVPNAIVGSHFQWTFASIDPSDWCFVYADLHYFVNGEISEENYRYYKYYTVYNLQLENEQFESCIYDEGSLEYIDEERVGHLDLEHDDEYYLNNLLSAGFKATAEFFENNNLKSLSGYTERVLQPPVTPDKIQ